MKITDFYSYKKGSGKIPLVTAYDYTTAGILNGTAVDGLLVGDSLAMTMHGHTSTLLATPELMALHVAAVAKGAPDKLVIGDMPFLSFRKGVKPAMDCVEALVRAGAQAVKLEGVRGHEDVVAHIVRSDVPVMGHLGLTPQSVQKFGGYKVQGIGEKAARDLLARARALEDLGCFGLVLECVPAPLAETVTAALRVPTIGIGAGPGTDGQILVLQDLLGLSPAAPKFVKRYLDGRRLVANAVNRFDAEIKGSLFPTAKESYACKS